MNTPTIKTKVLDHVKCGATVRAKRKAAGRSLLWLAAELGIQSSYLCDMEKGKRNWSEERFQLAISKL